ncbi:hypothetical protein [Streptomyces sp. NBC_01538]|uniref:hypothetical protein n=1 Tax=Streptomyces sp. NBC_01538 TaxID=2903897 RepID=UPI0038645350
MTTNTPPPNLAIHPSAREPGDGIWFAAPAGFTTLPLDALFAPSGSVESGHFQEMLAPVLNSAPDEASRQRFIATLVAAQRMFYPMRTEGTVHCSLGVHSDDTGNGDGNALISLFTVTWVEISWAPRRVTAARAIADAGGHTYIEYIELPSGPASFSETVRTPTVESGFPQEPLLQIHAHLPHPDGKSLALLTLSTSAVAQREQYRAILRKMAETVSFDDPFAPSTAALEMLQHPTA